MPRSGINAELGPISDAIGSINGAVGHLKTNEHISKAVRSLAMASADQIGDIIDEQVRMEGFESNLSHVYEFAAFQGQMPFKTARLFRFNITTNSSRNATVTWNLMASKMPIPTPRERNEMGHNDLSEESLEVKGFGDKKYIFRQKAVSFEYGATLSVRSRKGAEGWLAVPTRGFEKPKFVQGGYNIDLDFTAEDHVGAFTNKFYQLAELSKNNSQINERIERSIGTVIQTDIARAGRSKKKNFSIAYKAAERSAKSHMKRDTDNLYESFILDQ